MSDLENLTKSLSQIVATLQELTKKGVAQTTLQPEPPLRKTPDMTYNDFIKKALSNKKPLEVPSKKASYRLQQDLQILLELSQHNQISIKTFEELSNNKRVNRNTESLKSRYHDYLYRIDEKDMKKIVSWIEKEGVEGYIVFEQNQMRIQSNDPRENKDEKKRARGAEGESKKQGKNPRLKNIPANCKQLNEVLKLYSKMVNVPVKTLAQKLNQLSGDLVELDNYIETKDARMLWTEEEDEILKKGGAELQILKRYRGNAVETRKKYLGL